MSEQQDDLAQGPSRLRDFTVEAVDEAQHDDDIDLAREPTQRDGGREGKELGNDRQLSLTETTVIPPVTHERDEWPKESAAGQEGKESEDQQQQRQRRRGNLALTETTVSRPVTHDREAWTEGDARIYDEEAAQRRQSKSYEEEEEEKEKERRQPEQEEMKPEITPVRGRRGIIKLSKNTTQLYSVSYLVFFSIWGTLARLGLEALTDYTGAPVVTSVLWANVAGCIAMGFFLEDRSMFKEEWGDGPTQPMPSDKNEKHERIKKHKTVKKGIPLYIGLTTGFCGCLTSFSSFIRDVFLALSDDMELTSHGYGSLHHRNGGYSFMALVAVIIMEVGLSLSALVFGAHVALGVTDFTPTIPFRVTRKFVEPVCVFLGWGCWLGSIFLAIWPPDRHNGGPETWRGRAIFAVVFAPLGCLFRYYVSMFLNARISTFPLGTFTANIFGTIILGMCFDLQHVGFLAGSKSTLTSCQVLEGVMEGFCGSATTVSTWAAELNGLGRRRWAYFYGIMSVGVSLAFLVVIMGSLRWTKGFAPPVC